MTVIIVILFFGACYAELIDIHYYYYFHKLVSLLFYILAAPGPQSRRLRGLSQALSQNFPHPLGKGAGRMAEPLPAAPWARVRVVSWSPDNVIFIRPCGPKVVHGW